MELLCSGMIWQAIGSPSAWLQNDLAWSAELGRNSGLDTTHRHSRIQQGGKENEEENETVFSDAARNGDGIAAGQHAGRIGW